VLAVTVPAVGETVHTSTLYPTLPSNAYWQIITDDFEGNVLGCVLEGQDRYGNGDDCSIYNTKPVDFGGAAVINLEFDISLAVDSDNDHCLFQMKDSDDSSWTIIDYFAADTEGWEHRTYDFVCGGLGDWSVCDSVYFRFRWVSDGSGTDVGIRVDDVFLEYGDPTYFQEKVIEWDSDIGQTHEIWDLSPWLSPGEDFYLEWNYCTHYDDCWFWAIDDPYVYTGSTGSLLGPESFDDWLPDGWWEYNQDDICWEQESVTDWRDPRVPSGNPVAISESTLHLGHDASLYCPLIREITNDAVMVDFYSSYQDAGDFDSATFYVWHGIYIMGEFADDFEGDLSLWTVLDEGSGNLNVRPSLVGKIKATYR
jgi:hypothetical protein